MFTIWVELVNATHDKYKGLTRPILYTMYDIIIMILLPIWKKTVADISNLVDIVLNPCDSILRLVVQEEDELGSWGALQSILQLWRKTRNT